MAQRRYPRWNKGRQFSLALPRAMTSLGQDAFGLSGNGDQLIFWKANPEGSLEVIKAFPGSGWNPSDFIRLKDRLYFFVHNPSLFQDELWSSDDTCQHSLNKIVPIQFFSRRLFARYVCCQQS